MSGIARILVIDDEPQIRKFLRISLEANGFEVIEAATGKQGIDLCATRTPDLVVLDLGLPDMDGQEVVTRIRDWSPVPIIVLSVRAAEAEKVAALDSGANDYITKPFGIAEFMARLRAALRSRPAEEGAAQAVHRIGDLEVDLARHQVTLAGTPVKLSRKEFDLLRLLVIHADRVLTHDYLLREVWGPAHLSDTQYLRVYIGHLRQKLGDDAANPKLIVNEIGVGYRLVTGA